MAGYDAAYWKIVHDLDPAPAQVAVVERAAAPSARPGQRRRRAGGAAGPTTAWTRRIPQGPGVDRTFVSSAWTTSVATDTKLAA